MAAILSRPRCVDVAEAITTTVNIFRPEQNGQHFADAISDCFFLNHKFKLNDSVWHCWLCHTSELFCDFTTPASIYLAVRRLTARSREVSKPRDLGLDFFNHFEIGQAPRQQCRRDAWQISEWYDHYNIQSRGFETSRDLAVSRLTV